MSFSISSEIRWFFEGTLPDSVKNNFLKKGIFKFQEREDVYLKFNKTTQTGSKIRDGKFEIKPLVEKSGIFKINSKASGNIEIWEKWSSSDLTIPGIEENIEDQWLKVKKQRFLKKYQFVDHKITESNPEEELKAGCNFEITSLNIQNKEFWTLSFEAYKENDANIILLKDTVLKVMNDVDFPIQFPHSNGKTASYSTINSFSFPFLFTLNKYFE